MNNWHIYFIGLMFGLFTHSMFVNADSTMEPLSKAKDVLTEIWCVDGYRVLYVEKTTNETFQFFQVTQNAGIAVKAIECDGTEVREIK